MNNHAATDEHGKLKSIVSQRRRGRRESKFKNDLIVEKQLILTLFYDKSFLFSVIYSAFSASLRELI